MCFPVLLFYPAPYPADAVRGIWGVECVGTLCHGRKVVIVTPSLAWPTL